MLDNNSKLTNTEKNIITKYTKIYKFIFKYSIYVIIGLISILILNHQINKSENLDTNDNFIIEKAKLIGEFNKITNQNINNPDINVHILQWTLEMGEDLIFSTNNLISYKNLIMPRNMFLYDSSPIEWKAYFDKSNYNIEELEKFAQNIVFTNSDQIEKTIKNTISLPINESLKNTFYLDCIKDPKVINKSCDYYIDNFLDTFFVYDVSRDYEWLQEIFNNLKNTQHKVNMCESMKKYILYSNDTNEKIENIFISCGDNYYEDFHTIQLFLDIQNQLKEWYINQTVYQNEMLNAYKLISYQQIIYNDLHQSTINNIRFETYINYLQELLKKDNKIDSFYLDLTYRLNNNYLINLLNKLKYKVSDNKKTEIENIIRNLNKINNGDALVWYAWLRTVLTNPNLEKNHDINDNIEIDWIQQSSITKLINNIKSFSFFKIIKEKIAWDKIKISGYFSIKNSEWITPIYTSIVVKNINDELIIENIQVSKFDDLNETLNNIIKRNQYTIPEIYQYIQENLNLFLSKDLASTCELIKYMTEDIINWNKNITTLKLLECSPEKIAILKEEKVDKNNYKTYYKFTLDNFNITNIMISDKQIENEIFKSLNSINTNNITITNVVKEIITYIKKKVEYTQQWSNNIIITIEDFESYLWTMPDDIVEWDNSIISEFTIQGITFIWHYDVTSKKLWPLYFKYNNSKEDKENSIKKEDLEIKNFKLYLTQNNQNKINEFLINPIKYIQTIDPLVILYYNSVK